MVMMMMMIARLKAQSSARGRREETEKSRRLEKQDTGREWLSQPACELRRGDGTRL